MRQDVQQILKRTPKDKQVMMFSATMNKEIKDLSKKFMNNPTEILVDDENKLTLHGLLQYYIKLTENEKNAKLQAFLDTLSYGQIIIFVASKLRAQNLNKLLEDSGFPSITIYGEMPQEERFVFPFYEKKMKNP